jgi:predicted NBD/HSP70 family sugar kinase
MDHVAIDLGARKSQICVRNGAGEIVEEKRWDTWDLKRYLKLAGILYAIWRNGTEYDGARGAKMI